MRTDCVLDALEQALYARQPERDSAGWHSPGSRSLLVKRLLALFLQRRAQHQKQGQGGQGVLPPHFAELLGGLRDRAQGAVCVGDGENSAK